MRRTLTDWNFQLFAEEEVVEPPHEEETPKTFTQDEVNAMMEKRLARERAKLKEETEEAVKTAQEEAAKLAKMNADQKRDYETQKKDETIAQQQKEIEQLRAEALRAELSKQVGTELLNEGYPADVSVMEFVVGKDAEETKVLKDKFVAIIQADRKAQAERRATGITPKQYGEARRLDPFDNIMKKYKR